MHLRLATIHDLPQIKSMYQNIIEHMEQHNISIWDDIYPCEYFKDDIKNNHLYILVENHIVIAAFALYPSYAIEDDIIWQNKEAKALYIDRLGVNIDYQNKGIASKMLNHAITIAKQKDINYLRLFVVDYNKPAIKLYKKNGFIQAKGIHDEIIDNDLVLHEYRFEMKL